MARFRSFLSLACIMLSLAAGPLTFRAAQAAPTVNALDPNFIPFLATPGTIKGILPLSAGKTLVYGSFTSIAGVPRNQIAILNPDGTVDPNFKLAAELEDSNLSLVIEAAALVSGGKILIGGLMDWFGPDYYQGHLFRLNSDGSLDTTFKAGGFVYTPFTPFGLNSRVTALRVDGSGRILVGGDFTAPHNRITRLNADGSPDASFNPGSGANGQVRKIELQSTGHIILAGDFTTVNDVATRGVARLGVNGAFDASFFGAGVSGTSTGGLDPAVGAIYVGSDDAVLVGGTFSYLKGQLAPTLTRIGSNGVVDTAFAPFARGYLESVTSLLVVDGNLVAGGWNPELYFNGKPMYHNAEIFLMNAASGAFVNWVPFKGSPTDVWALAKRSDGKVLAGGSFIQTDDVENRFYPGLLLFAPATLVIDQSFKPIVGGQPGLTSVGVQSDGHIVTAGSFYQANGALNNGLARLDANGSPDAGFTAEGLTHKMTLRADNKIVAIGEYTQPPDHRNLAVFGQSGKIEAYATLGFPTNIITQPDLKIITSQAFSPGVTRFTPTLTPDTDFNTRVGSGISNSQSPDLEFDRINTVVLQGSKIVAGGSFSTFSGASIQNLVRLQSDGTPDGSFVSLPFTVFNFRSEVFALAVQADNKILVGGRFSTVGGVASPTIARLNPDGTLDTSFHSPFPDSGATIYSLALQPDGKIIAGGNMQIVEDGHIYNNLVRLNRDGSRDTTFNANVRGSVKALSFAPPSAILLAGDFNLVDGQPRFGLARYNVTLVMSALSSNYPSGAPGSFFTLQATNFLPGEILTVSVNGHLLGDVTADSGGIATFILDTTAADPGPYFCMIQPKQVTHTALTLPATSQVLIQVSLGAPLRAKDGTATLLTVSAGTAGKNTMLPFIIR